MIKLNFIPVLVCFTLFACKRNDNAKQLDNNRIHIENYKDMPPRRKVLIDSDVYAILPIDTSYHRLFKDAAFLRLTNKELKILDNILTKCINVHNLKRETTKQFSEFIDLKKYKRQYVPYINSNGVKKVYVNCFCIDSNFGFDDWKKNMVVVEDGGSCYFQVIINLTTLKYEKFSTNGYG